MILSLRSASCLVIRPPFTCTVQNGRSIVNICCRLVGCPARASCHGRDDRLVASPDATARLRCPGPECRAATGPGDSTMEAEAGHGADAEQGTSEWLRPGVRSGDEHDRVPASGQSRTDLRAPDLGADS